MSNEIETSVRQETYETNGEGAAGRIRLNKRGELVTVDLYTQWSMDGRVFNASNPVSETDDAFVETGRGTANIAPSLLLDIPLGTTIVPLELLADIGNTPGTSVDMNFWINTDDAIRYVSGGVASTPINMRKDKPRTSSCVVYSAATAIVASANTDDDMLWTLSAEEEATPKLNIGDPLVFWSARRNITPTLVGPASFLFYAMGASTNDQEFFWSIKWAEFDSTDMV